MQCLGKFHQICCVLQNHLCESWQAGQTMTGLLPCHDMCHCQLDRLHLQSFLLYCLHSHSSREMCALEGSGCREHDARNAGMLQPRLCGMMRAWITDCAGTEAYDERVTATQQRS